MDDTPNIINCESPTNEDQALVNLKILANLKAGQKLVVSENVFKVDPGEYLAYDIKSKNLKNIKWYTFKKKSVSIKSFGEAAEFTEDNIKRSLKLWTISDVPICFLLSGGLDSGVLSSLYNEIFKGKINTFSLGFIQKKLQKWNEIDVANTLVKKINSNHKNIFLKIDDLLNQLFKIWIQK